MTIKADPKMCLPTRPIRVSCQILEEHDAACTGQPSLVEMMEQRLDELMDTLMGDDNDDPDETLRGEARGIAWCIAVVRMPYCPDVDIIRQRAMERWEARQDSEVEDPTG